MSSASTLTFILAEDCSTSQQYYSAARSQSPTIDPSPQFRYSRNTAIIQDLNRLAVTADSQLFKDSRLHSISWKQSSMISRHVPRIKHTYSSVSVGLLLCFLTDRAENMLLFEAVKVKAKRKKWGGGG
jgi:hypothetical protein